MKVRELKTEKAVLGKWLVFGLLADFFDEPADFFVKLEKLLALRARFGDLPLDGGELSEDFRLEYDDLFKGTNADVYIPLWASICLKPNGALLDATTLEVVRIYHRHGYMPKEMDGNPPDYIGQFLRFLCYLIACGRNEAAERFISDFALDTAASVAENIEKYAKNAVFLDFARLLQSAFADMKDGDFAAYADDLSSLEASEFLPCFEAYEKGPGKPIPDEPERVTKSSGRNNCGGKCNVGVRVADGCVLDVEPGYGMGDPELHACLRGRAYRSTFLSGIRLRYPMIRRGERGEGLFRRITWEEAAEIATKELKRTTEKYGVGSRLVVYATGIQGLMRPDRFAQRLLNLDGGSLRIYGDYSSVNTQEATPYVYGDKYSGSSLETHYDTKYMILWGHNPVTTIFGTQLRMVLADLKERGIKIVVIDPRKSDTAIALGTEWIGLKPSTDGALADAMAYTIWSEGLQDRAFMDKYCLGFDADHMPDGVPRELNYHDYLFGVLDGVVKDADWGEKITGVPAETIRRIAREYATAKPACILPGLGNQRIGNGEQTTRGIAALTCLTGNVGKSGGGAAGSNILREEPMPGLDVGKDDYPGMISCFMWTQAIREGHLLTKKRDHVKNMDQLESDLKYIFNIAGDVLINQHSDINATKELLRDTGKCEFIVTSDVFMTPSARFSDLVLPGVSFMEEDDINMPWRHGHYILAENKVIEPIFGSGSEYDFLAAMAKNMGLFDAWSDGFADRESHLRFLYEKFTGEHPELGLPGFDDFMAAGGHTYENPKTYIAYKEQIEDPERHPFPTPSGKIEIVSERLYSMEIPEIPAYPGYVPCKEGPQDPLAERYPLQLIGYHTKRRCHSIHDQNPVLEEADPQLLWINPADAAARGIKAGDTVHVFNDRGAMRIGVKITDRVIPGVVALSQGAWYTVEKGGAVDSQGRPEEVRGSINVLTAFEPTPLAKGNPQHTNLVEVSQPMKLSGIVLAGGASSRMGKNKAGLLFGGKTFLEIQVAKLKACGIDDIIIAGGSLSAEGARTVPDVYPRMGPLSGIHAGLQAAKNEAAVVMSVDTPLLPASAVLALAEAYEGGMFVYTCGGKIEPLAGIYDRGAAAACEEILKNGGGSVMDLLTKRGFRTFEYSGPSADLQNINTAEEYGRLG